MEIEALILECARIPSFSTFEERLHPFIVDYLSNFNHVKLNKIKDNNILLEVEGDRKKKPVAITSHLDKINHFGEQFPEVLDAKLIDREIWGQMDNSVGVGICLKLIELSVEHAFPPLLLLFSEMEESTGLKEHPHLLKNGGKDVGPQIGARRLSAYIDENNLSPAAFITIDTTPVFKGKSGVALYTEYWEKSGNKPNPEVLNKIEAIKTYVLSTVSEIHLANGTNDYLIYGEYFGSKEKGNIPSIAIEPAIFPYHQRGEKVFIKDVHLIVNLLESMLQEFDFSFS